MFFCSAIGCDDHGYDKIDNILGHYAEIMFAWTSPQLQWLLQWTLGDSGRVKMPLTEQFEEALLTGIGVVIHPEQTPLDTLSSKNKVSCL